MPLEHVTEKQQIHAEAKQIRQHKQPCIHDTRITSRGTCALKRASSVDELGAGSNDLVTL